MKYNGKANILSFLTIAFALSIASTSGQTSSKDLNIVFIGNSITYGANLEHPETDAPPVVAAEFLMHHKQIGTVSFANQGHGGYTTVDFLPSTGKTFGLVETAAKTFPGKEALLVFSIDLGTNDSAIKGPNGSPVSAEHYRENLKAIADSLLKEFPNCIIVIQRPIWYSTNTYNGAMYLAEGLDRLQTYFPEIDQLVVDYAETHPKQVFTGDTKAFKYFKTNCLTDLGPEKGNMGTFYLHPNKKGAAALGTYWGEAIYKIVKWL